MIYNSTVYKNRRGNTVVLPSSRVDSTTYNSRLHDILAIVALVALCIGSSIVSVA